MCNRDQYRLSTHVTDLDNIQNSSIHSLLSSKYHEAQMYQLNIHAEIPDPVIHSYLTDLDLAVVLGHLMNNAIDGARKAQRGLSLVLPILMKRAARVLLLKVQLQMSKLPLSMMSTSDSSSMGVVRRC